jgi:hypothetical protein
VCVLKLRVSSLFTCVFLSYECVLEIRDTFVSYECVLGLKALFVDYRCDLGLKARSLVTSLF